MPELALNLSRGCGNTTGFADLQPGDVVVDLGCGGGIDLVLASQKVGPGGRVVGIDFAPTMIERAKEVVAEVGIQDRNIEFRVTDIENTGLPDDHADVIISNCVINLCPDKDAVYREAFRILRPGGRLAISDIILSQAIDPDLQQGFRATWAGCLGGAVAEEDYWQTVREAGFAEIHVVARHSLTFKELESMACCPGEAFTPAPAKGALAAVQGRVTSLKFTTAKSALSRAAQTGGRGGA